jgi:hypothetical protein
MLVSPHFLTLPSLPCHRPAHLERESLIAKSAQRCGEKCYHPPMRSAAEHSESSTVGFRSDRLAFADDAHDGDVVDFGVHRNLQTRAQSRLSYKHSCAAL